MLYRNLGLLRIEIKCHKFITTVRNQTEQETKAPISISFLHTKIYDLRLRPHGSTRRLYMQPKYPPQEHFKYFQVRQVMGNLESSGLRTWKLSTLDPSYTRRPFFVCIYIPSYITHVIARNLSSEASCTT